MTEATTTTGTNPREPIIVHHLENARSQRILWLLEELGIPYEVRKYKRSPQRLAPKELSDVHPLGKSPVITDGNLTLAESGAIVEYLIATYGQDKDKVTQGGTKWVDNMFFTHYAEGSVQPLLVRRLLFQLTTQNAESSERPIIENALKNIETRMDAPDLKKHGELIEAQLKKTGGWFAGGENPTSADYMMTLTVEIFIDRVPEYAGEATREYIRRVQARPAYKRATEKGGEYAYLLK